MQRGKSVKIKEVIESFCKLLSALGVEFVPNTDTFRRAKYNKGDAVDDLWKLLSSLLSRTVLWEFRSQTAQEQDVGAQARLVSGVLWQLGYGAPWLGRTLSGGSLGQEVGSRDLLLALGWVISCGGLLEALLAEQTLGLETLTAPPGIPDCRPRAELPLVAGRGVGCGGSGLAGQGLGGSGWEGVLRRVQWEQGRLQRLWRGLYATQEERARLLHQEWERLRADIGVLQIYLDWKQMEPLFWSWMVRPSITPHY
ncbi:hypothetical protein GJAV_G00022520 [Gymnothorax javanicus]|nr:hypothetical protein GJAV_G00022520 [Gymnothorax javanicus]